jgi:transposase-like protein
VPFRVFQHLRMEHGLPNILGCHVDCSFLRLRFLRHGDPMRSQVDLLSVIHRYGTDDQCRAYLTELRWPDGIACPECRSVKISKLTKRDVYDCDSCRYQFSTLAGTIFHDTHLPLTKWFFAVYIMCESRKGVSANQLKRMLRVSYKPMLVASRTATVTAGAENVTKKKSSLAFVNAPAISGSSMPRMHAKARWRSTSKKTSAPM